MSQVTPAIAASPAAILIRDAHPDEHARVGALMVSVYAALAGFPTPDAQPDYYAMLAEVGRLAAPPATRLLVAVDRERLVGGVLYVGDMTRYGAGGIVAHETDTSAFRLLAVDPAARGLGAGKALVNACLGLARAAHHRQVVIHSTRAMATAWTMYERLGFARAPELDFMQGALPVFGFRLAL